MLTPRSGPRHTSRGRPWLHSHALAGWLLGSCALTSAIAAPMGAALKKFEAGTAAFAANHPAEALALFQASMELEPSPNTRFKIAKCFLALGKTGSAYTSFRRAAKEAQDRINATGEQRFAPTRVAAEIEAARLDGLVPRLYLVLPADLPPAVRSQLRLALDGSPLPAVVWDSAMELDPGPHQLTATSALTLPYEVGITAVASETKRLELPLVRRKLGTVQLSFSKRPVGLAVAVDAQPLDAAKTDDSLLLAEGRHTIVVSAPGYRDFSTAAVVHDQGRLSVAVTLRQRAGTIHKAAFFSTGGAALALLGIGIALGVQAQSAEDAQVAIDPLLRDPMVRDSIKTQATIANVLFGVSGALGLTAAGLAFFTRWRTPAAEPRRSLAGWLPAPAEPQLGLGSVPVSTHLSGEAMDAD